MFPASLRMMAPLQAQNQQLQTLRAHNEELQARCDGLQSKCQELHRQVAALQPLAGRVRALEGVGTEEGGRRQRQRVGPAPHDAQPSDAAVAQLGVVDAVEALWTHGRVARVAEKACEQIRRLSKGMMADLLGELPESMARSRSLCVCGLDAVVEAMRAHPQVAAVQQEGCLALMFLTRRIGAESATESGTVEAVVDAMRAHLQAAEVLKNGAAALMQSTNKSEAAVQRVADAGGLQLMVAAMRTHPLALEVQQGSVAVLYSCRGLFCRAPYGQRVSEVGGRAVLSAALKAFDESDSDWSLLPLDWSRSRQFALSVLNCLAPIE